MISTATSNLMYRAGTGSPAPAKRGFNSMGPVKGLYNTFRTALRVYKERRALMGLSDSTLKDLGLSRADAHREATRSFWDLPECR
jgi:uncharacterized protein YjiS (DUF1127 family)